MSEQSNTSNYAIHIERLRARFGFKKKTEKQEREIYLSRITDSESRDFSYGKFAVTAEKLAELNRLTAHVARITNDSKVGA